jgi:flagellar assembly factor FliW
VNIITARFGEINVDESEILDMRAGIIGFEHLKKFVLHIQDGENPFWWLQSLDEGAIAFVVINPFVVKADYEPVIDDNDTKLLEIESAGDVVLLTIVTIRQNPFLVSVNLRAPIVVNARKKIAKQVILENMAYPVRYNLTVSGSGEEASTAGDCKKKDDCEAASL